MASNVIGSAEYQIGADLNPLRKALNDSKGLLTKHSAMMKKSALAGVGLGGGLLAFNAISGAISGVVNGIGDSISAAIDFQEQLGTINTVAQLSQKELAALGDEIQKLSEESGKDTEDLTSAMYDLVSAGVSVDDAMAVLRDSTTLATGALSTTGEAVDLLTTSINAWKLEASDSTRITNIWAQTVANGKVTAAQLASSIAQVAPIASAAGVSIEEVAAAYATMTAQGTPAAQAATQVRAAITALLKPNAQLLALQKTLNGTTFEQMLREDGLAATLQAVSDAADGKTAAITAALGSTEAYNGMLQITGDSAAAFDKNMRSVKDSTQGAGAAAGMAAERMDTLAFKQERLNAKLKTLSQDVGGLIIPMLTTITDVGAAAVDTIRYLADGIGSIADDLLSIVGLGGADTDLERLTERLGLNTEAFMAFRKEAQETAQAERDLADVNEDVASQFSELGLSQDEQIEIMRRAGEAAKATGASSEDAARAVSIALAELGVSGLAGSDGIEQLTQRNEDLAGALATIDELLGNTADAQDELAAARADDAAILSEYLMQHPDEVQALIETTGALKVKGKAWELVTALFRGAGKEEAHATTQWRALQKALGNTSGIDAAVGGLKGIKDESKAADKQWRNLIKTGDRNKRAIKALNDEIDKWERRYKRAIKNNDSEAAAFAAAELLRLRDEKTARVGVRDEVQAQHDAIMDVGAAADALPDKVTLRVVALTSDAVQRLKDVADAARTAASEQNRVDGTYYNYDPTTGSQVNAAMGGIYRPGDYGYVGEAGLERIRNIGGVVTVEPVYDTPSLLRPSAPAGGRGDTYLTVVIKSESFLGTPTEAERWGQKVAPVIGRELARIGA